jgi:hypothetical protein
MLFRFGVEAQHAAVRNADRLDFGLAAKFGELRLEQAILLVRGLEACKCGAEVCGARNLVQRVGRIETFVLVFDVLGDTRPVHAALRCVTDEFKNLGGVGEFLFGKLVGFGLLEIRRRIIGRL